MSLAKVLRLDEYRDRRLFRLELAGALNRTDRSRQEIFRLLAEAADHSGADRVATVWVDEYGAGLVHPHVVLDLASDRPRRSFSIGALNHAWEMGVPGVHDDGLDTGAGAPTTLAIALGSDGTRAWFLVADSVASRAKLERGVRDRLMFVAGECAAITLHRDLDTAPDDSHREQRFAGWPILRDIEGREEDEPEGWRIAQRFVVGRLVCMLIDDDLAISPDRIKEQSRRARRELGCKHGLDQGEWQLWSRVLEAYEGQEFDLLARTLIELAELAEGRDHVYGALELYRCSFAIAAAIGAPETASTAARLKARLLRRRADWQAANEWYDTAHDIAAAAGIYDTAAHALSGLALIKKDLGNLPAARECFNEALVVAERSEDPDTVATIYAGLLTLEQAAGNFEEAVAHGWVAVATSVSEVSKTRLLASLAGALGQYGDREAAEDAWAVVANRSEEAYYRIYAYDALAHLASLRGDGPAFDGHSKACDELGWENGPKSAKAEILYYRGLSCRALARFDTAEQWFGRAIGFAEDHGFNQILFDAEEALATLSTYVVEHTEPPLAAPPDVREGVRAMREELVGA